VCPDPVGSERDREARWTVVGNHDVGAGWSVERTGEVAASSIREKAVAIHLCDWMNGDIGAFETGRIEAVPACFELDENKAIQVARELDALKARIKREAKLLAQFADSYANPEGDWEAGKRSGLENGASRMFRLLSCPACGLSDPSQHADECPDGSVVADER